MLRTAFSGNKDAGLQAFQYQIQKLQVENDDLFARITGHRKSHTDMLLKLCHIRRNDKIPSVKFEYFTQHFTDDC